jgi:hypothetical protein
MYGTANGNGGSNGTEIHDEGIGAIRLDAGVMGSHN